MGLLFVDKNS